MITKKLPYSFLPLIALLALSASCKKEETKVAMPVATVEVISPEIKDMPVYKTWVGTLNGKVNATIRAQVTGYLMEQCYENGQIVKKGQELFKIDRRTFDAALSQAQGTLAQAEAAYKKNKMDVDRYTPLVETNAVSHKQLDDAVQAMKESEASIVAAKAAVEAADLNVKFTTITSPIDGVAGIAQAQIGDLVSQASAPLTEVSMINPIRVEFAIREQDWLSNTFNEKLNSNAINSAENNLQIILSNGDIYQYSAKIIAFDRQVNNNTGTIQVEGELNNPDNRLRPGMFVNIRAKINSVKNAIVVPTKAVITQQGNYYVTVVDDKNEASIIPVKPGVIYENEQAVTPLYEGMGLTTESKVVVVGTLRAMSAAAKKNADGSKEKLKVITYTPRESKALMSIKHKPGENKDKTKPAEESEDKPHEENEKKTA